MSSLAAQHSEWLSLVEISGPFLTLPALKRALPLGLDPTPLPLVDDLRVAWKEVGDDDTLTPRWIRWVLNDLLELPSEVVKEGTEIGPALTYVVPEHGVRLRPDFAIVDPESASHDKPARMLVMTLPLGTSLDERLADSKWSADAIDRMAELCRGTGVRLGLVTNGEHWAIVDAPVGGATGAATWDANLWLEERLTLDAFTTLLGVRRFFSVAETDTLEAMLGESANAEAEVTDQLGKQVRSAVELLVDAMSRANRDRGGHLFDDLTSAQVYEAAVTVMMRLVFLLSAEERGLFLLGDETYDATYAVSTLRGQLEEEANAYGEEVIARRTDAWHRVLATFRMVFGGVQHENLRLPAYGGSLFDPDRFPFLEGRQPDEPWRSTPSNPLPIDNRTVLHILGALQILTFKDRRGAKEARRLSFRALDVEQIGHVYEGLLDHSAVRVDEVAVGLGGKRQPEIALELIEREATQGTEHLADFLAQQTGLSLKAVEKALSSEVEAQHLERLTSACDNDRSLADRIVPFLGLLRSDLAELPVVYLPNSMYVTQSGDRRSSGTYYTPRVLAEEMVKYALDTVVYQPGPVQGAEPKSWTLLSSRQLLDLKVCDMTMGSGAFLVATCRYLSARVLEAWDAEGVGAGDVITSTTDTITSMPSNEHDREILARRLIADRCIYGVDRNPMAVEMAKLSMWLITLAKDQPFTFVDHALRLGDSLLGITDLHQLDSFHLDPVVGQRLHGGSLFDPAVRIAPVVKAALEKRRKLESFPVIDVRDSERKQQLLGESNRLLDQLKVIADLVVGAALSTGVHSRDAYNDRLVSVATEVMSALEPGRREDDQADRLFDLRRRAEYWLDAGRPPMAPDRHCLHWPLEFPEVFLKDDPDGRGFDAFVGNPPFIGNRLWLSALGDISGALDSILGTSTPGKIDYALLFFRRVLQLAHSQSAVGLLGPVSLTEGECLHIGLGYVSANRAIYRAVRSTLWPSTANVNICKVWFGCLDFHGKRLLDGVAVDVIQPSLLPSGRSLDDNPFRLSQILCFEGVQNAKGEALVFADGDVRLALAPQHLPLKRYATADDLTSTALRSTRRTLDLEDRKWPQVVSMGAELVEFLETSVRPHRHLGSLKSYPGLEERWWQYWRPRAPDRRATVSASDHMILLPKVTKYLTPVRVPSDWVATNSFVVVGETRADLHGIMVSEIFNRWAIRYGSSRDTRINLPVYPSVSAFPLPDSQSSSLSALSETFQSELFSFALKVGAGTTAVLNRVHAQDDTDAQVETLRATIVEITAAVIELFGWSDVPLEFEFRETWQGVRFTLGESIETDVLERLLRLNHVRNEDEAARGIQAQDETSGKTTRRRPNQLVLDDAS